MNYGLYVVTDDGRSRGRTHVETAGLALDGGADVIQLRDKTLPGRRLLENALIIGKLARRAGALFIVNDRLDIALASKAHGVHLGQDDLPLKSARRLAPAKFIIGVTAHDVGEAVRAQSEGADYIGLSPIYATGSKSDAGDACGVEMIRRVKSLLSVPVVAIGGINISNAKEVLGAGADGLAVISAVVGQEDVAASARRLKTLILECRRH